MVNRLVVDTSVLVEYLDYSSPFSGKVEELFARASRGESTLYILPQVVAELYYVASRFYEAMGVRNPNNRAFEYILWLQHHPGIVFVDSLDYRLSIRAGELKKQLRIALTDCYVIAYAESINGKPVFRRIEREMKNSIDKIRKLDIIFLEDT